jgi:hypothetical protein
MKDKCLFVINGDTFRLGGQGSVGKGGEESINRQKLATDSHNNFFESIEKKLGVKCEIYLNIYTCNDEYDQKLLEWYGERVVNVAIHPKRFENELGLVYDTTRSLKEFGLDDYRFVMMIRPDCYIKKYFAEIFKVDDNRVLYAHLDAGYKMIDSGGSISFLDALGSKLDVPHVCHNITYCPHKHFNLFLDNQVWHWHDSLLRLRNHISRNEIGFFVDTFHWCCSSLDWNPLYSLVGRGECLEYKVPNMTYDFETNTVQYIDTIEKYKHLMYTDTIEENLKNYE